MPSSKDIVYLPNSDHQKHRLDVYFPSREGSFPVLVFIHGGSWYQGNKDLYAMLGKNMADKGLVTVITNYRLGGEATYLDMAADCSAAMKWVAESIHTYKGQNENIFLAGHSAGGHLAALLSLNKKFLGEDLITQSLKGCILIDAFGLNMDYVMQHNLAFFVQELRKVFTEIPENWIDAAPVHFIDNSQIPFLILTGEKTYPYLTLDNAVFITNLDSHQVINTQQTLAGKNHREMITCMENSNDETYGILLNFIWLIVLG